MAMGAQGAGRISISDAEMVALTASLHTMEMSPGCTDLPRLAAHAKMYDRYRILSLRIEYVPTSGMATTGSVAVTLQPGPKNAAIKDEASVLKCLPNLALPAWKAGNLRAGPQIDSQRFLSSGGSGDTGIAVTVYAVPTAASIGYLKVHYTVEFAFPKPFT